MSIAKCPRCLDEVTIPPGADTNAEVRCPLCREEYVLSEALAQMPPSLILLREGENGEFQLQPEERVASGFDFSEQPAPASAVVSRPRPKTRPSRPQRSAFGEVIKIVAGGVVGISLAILILWWGVHKDPFQLGPPVSRYASFLVPERFHDPSLLSPANPADPEKKSGESSNVGNFPMSSGFPEEDEKQGDQSKSKQEEKRSANNKGVKRKASRRGRLEIRSAPRYSSDELLGSINDAQQAASHWALASGSNDHLSKPMLDLYKALSSVGQNIAFTEPEQPKLSRQARELLLDLAKHEHFFTSIGKLTGAWLDAPNRAHNGIVAAGTVAKIQKRGDAYETMLKLPGSGRLVAFVSGEDPQSHYEPDAEVVVLGSIVDSPQDVPAYTGLAPVFIVGHPVKLSGDLASRDNALAKRPKRKQEKSKQTKTVDKNASKLAKRKGGPDRAKNKDAKRSTEDKRTEEFEAPPAPDPPSIPEAKTAKPAPSSPAST